MSHLRLALLTTTAILAFAANSLLCREALAGGHIDAATFTLVRLIAGAVMLALLLLGKFRRFTMGGSWIAASSLFGYAAAFSFAYISLSAGTGALILFGAVQSTMISYGLWTGERLSSQKVFGASLAFAGLVWLMLPGIEAPPLFAALTMFAAGVFWGLYSLLGKQAIEPTIATAGNFIRAIPFAIILFWLMADAEHTSLLGLVYAVASGALASGLGYALWYAVLPALPATNAATIQLSVPVLAALGGVLFLDEQLTLRFILASILVLGGITLFIKSRHQSTK
ncbi:DMT family transporter [Zhongshania marina]|uniref:EamA family transporter n=1 Tax=Zhongshania marina TaxID=2304603 RepID=A0A2S4HDL4_9GAMM|nr:DMT family transporter [Marortus luteolus]POP52084.1 EamA family transporter [Marortus luteolus]